MAPPSANDGKEDEEGRKTDDNFAIDVFELFVGDAVPNRARAPPPPNFAFTLFLSSLSAPSADHATFWFELRKRTNARRRRPCAFLKVGLKGKKEKEMILFFRPQKARDGRRGENGSMRRSSSRWL